MDEHIAKDNNNPINIQDEPNYCIDCGEVKEMLEGEEVCVRCLNEEEEKEYYNAYTPDQD